jgi:hypothetical protein
MPKVNSVVSLRIIVLSIELRVAPPLSPLRVQSIKERDNLSSLINIPLRTSVVFRDGNVPTALKVYA